MDAKCPKAFKILLRPPPNKSCKGKALWREEIHYREAEIPKNHVKIRSAGIRGRINLSRWIWPINGPDLVGISQVGGCSSSDMMNRR